MITLLKEGQKTTKAIITRYADYNLVEAGGQGAKDLRTFFLHPISYTVYGLNLSSKVSKIDPIIS